ncbi:MAG: glycosyltransferase family 2 protein [Terriglobia bacterium]
MPIPEPSSVSVIIPTKSRAAELEAAVRSVLLQDHLPFELLIIDQSSEDASRQSVERAYTEAPSSARTAVKLTYITDPTISGGAAARNRAMDTASGDVWLFLDDDVVLEADFIKELLSVYAQYPGIAGASGVITNYKPYPWPFRLWDTIFVRGPFADDRQTMYQKAGHMRHVKPVRVDRLGGGLMSFRAEAIRGLRFDGNLRGVSDGEDVDFCARLGSQAILMITPRARLVHNHSPAGRERDHWLRRVSRSQHYLYRRNWNHGSINRISFLWLNTGYALIATLASVRRLSWEPWRALRAGIRDAKAIPTTAGTKSSGA